MEQTQQNLTWLDEELTNLQAQTQTLNIEQRPTLKLEAGKVTKFSVDFTKPFASWIDKDKGTTKKILPVTHKGEKKYLWLNTKNPLYRRLAEAGKKGQTEFAVSTTGSQKETRYTLVEED